MLAQAQQSRGQVVQVFHTNGTFSAPEIQSGRLSKSLINTIRALRTFTGNPDNEYKRRERHRCRISKNTWTLHCPHPWARDRLQSLVPDP
jgi:hypothetical protein